MRHYLSNVQIMELFIYLFFCHDIFRLLVHRCVNFPLGFKIPLGNVLEIAVNMKVGYSRFLKVVLSKLALAVDCQIKLAHKRKP